MENTETLVLEYRQQTNKNKAIPTLADLYQMKPGEVANLLFDAGEHVPTQFLSSKKRAEQYARVKRQPRRRKPKISPLLKRLPQISCRHTYRPLSTVPRCLSG